MDTVEVEGGFLVTTQDGVVRVSTEEQREEQEKQEEDEEQREEEVVEEHKEEEPEDQKEDEEGFCLGTVLLLLFMIAGLLQYKTRSE